MNRQLFFDFDFLDENQVVNLDYRFSNQGPLHMVLNQFMDFTSKHEQPIVKPVPVDIPQSICALHRINDIQIGDSDCCPHFFVDDNKIEPAWSRPILYIKKLKRFNRSISPNFFIFENMVEEQKRWNSFRNKFLTALWQSFGINVIPAPSCGKISDVEYYMEGWPKASLIAINSTGIGYDKHNRHLFLTTYNAMIDILKPKHILRYGPFVEGEKKEISTYYSNDAKRKEAKDGRK